MSEQKNILTKRCRTCLDVNGGNVLLNTKVSVDGDTELITIADMIFSCTGLDVSGQDEKPKGICLKCSTTAYSYYQFRVTCIKSDLSLQYECNSQKTKRESKLKGLTDESLHTVIEIPVKSVEIPTIEIPDSDEENDGDHKTSNNNLDIMSMKMNIVTDDNISNQKVKVEEDDTLTIVEEIIVDNNSGHIDDPEEDVDYDEDDEINGDITSDNESLPSNDDTAAGSTIVTFNDLTLEVTIDTNKANPASATTSAPATTTSTSLAKAVQMVSASAGDTRCAFCDRAYTHHRSLCTHLRRCHNRLHSFANAIKVIKCRLCGDLSYHFREFMNDLNRHVKGLNAPSLTQAAERKMIPPESVETLKLNLEQFQKCLGFDSDVLKIVARLGKDVKDFEKKKDLTDTIMNSIYGISNLKEMNVRRKKMQQCSECERAFDGITALKRHMNRIHTKFTCVTCKARFYDADDSSKHNCCDYNEDGTQNSYSCKLCSRSFYKVANLRVHMRKHEELKKYMCKKCDSRFAQKATLVEHRKMGFCEYACELCTQRFKDRAGLSEHLMEAHSKEAFIKCLHCAKTFKYKRHMIAHCRAAHWGERPYKCTSCPRSFADKALLSEHMQLKH